MTRSPAQTEILAFNAQLPEFAALNAEVLAVSCDSEYSHLAWANTKRDEGGLGPDLKLKLVADKSMKIARDYGVLLEVSTFLSQHPALVWERFARYLGLERTLPSQEAVCDSGAPPGLCSDSAVMNSRSDISS